jgi:membrane-anchored protein YejM (alkaline phosphatase superfamily)
MDPSERKHAKFRELAEKRTNKALEAVRLIGNLSNRQVYVFEDAEVRKVVRALRDAVADVEGRFGKSAGRAGGDFKL